MCHFRSEDLRKVLIVSVATLSLAGCERGQQLPVIDTLIELATVLHIPLSDFFRSFNDQRKLSRERAENEAKIEETVRSLSDPAVAIAAEQIKALTKVR